MYIYVCMYVCIYIYVDIYIYTCVCIYVYIYTYIYIYIYMYNGILLSHKNNEILTFERIWLELEGITLSEITQRKTNTA